MNKVLLTLFVFVSTLLAYSQNTVAFTFYWTPRTVAADCSGIVGEYPSGSLDVVRIHGGVTIHETVTPDPTHHAGFLSNIGPVSVGDTIYAVLTLPDGKTLQYDDILGPSNIPSILREVSAKLGTYVVAPGLTFPDGSSVPEAACSMRKDAYYQ